MKSISLHFQVHQLTADWRAVWVMPASSFSIISVLLKPQHCILISHVFWYRLSFPIILIRRHATKHLKLTEFSFELVLNSQRERYVFNVRINLENSCGFYEMKNNIRVWFQASFSTAGSTFTRISSNTAASSRSFSFARVGLRGQANSIELNSVAHFFNGSGSGSEFAIHLLHWHFIKSLYKEF